MGIEYNSANISFLAIRFAPVIEWREFSVRRGGALFVGANGR